MKYIILALLLVYIGLNSYNISLNDKLITLQDRKITLLEDIVLKQQELAQLEREMITPESFEGIASYYSEEGCIGCREDLLMANGERFYNENYTIAMNVVPLGSWVRITNPLTNDTTLARVTDTGGFTQLGRVADLSPAVKKAINCTDLCDVIIERVL
jgi:rare lipoprotein A (peptidoglycan hydrolase)